MGALKKMSEAKSKMLKDESWKKRIHFEIEKENGKFYLCNQAVNTFPEKRTNLKESVTCRNCLNKLNKMEVYKNGI